MKLLFKSRQKIDDEEVLFLEKALYTTLQPIQPRQSFISDLKARLVADSKNVDIRPMLLRYSLFIFAGIFGGVLLIATSMRALFTLLVTFGVIKHLRQEASYSVATRPLQTQM
jgi:hypothetical protein